MGRIARVVVPDLPHHVTQRGNRRLPTFLQDDDYRRYLALLAEECRRYTVAIWAYCRMLNHSHLVPVPSTASGLAAAIGAAHQHYTQAINARMGWTGHLWQGRFASYPLEDDYLRNVIRYVVCNAQRAGLVEQSGDYPWCSAAARVPSREDPLITMEPLQSMIEDWAPSSLWSRMGRC